MALAGGRLTKDGVLIILARNHRTQERNRAEARERLFDLIRRAATPPKPRRPTKPTFASKRRRLDDKTMRAKLKRNRSKVQDD
jgi:ribosome-associated protein